MPYFSGQGKIYGGVPGTAVLRHFGNVPGISVDLSRETLDHNESMSGQRLQDLSITTAQTATVNMTLEDFTLENLALGLYGQAVDRTGGSVTGEDLGSPASNALVKLANPKVSSVVIKDSAATPATLVAGTDYDVLDADYGLIQLYDISGFTLPLVADYAYGSFRDVVIFTQPPPVRRIVANLLNTADGNAKYQVELYRVQFDPLQNFGLISNDLSQIELSGKVQIDSSVQPDPVLGYFGRVLEL